MSIRLDEVATHTCVRGTHVSVSLFAPSKLHCSVLQTWGLPNARNVVVVDGVALYVRFDHRNPDVMYVWAHPPEPPHTAPESAAPRAFPMSRCLLM